ncbi:MAG: hypothetical protein IJ218_04615 [Alphaproteobacteria bacterium]|nr:hypothetical protein [Alphaproteobacteria bacterium]
MEKIFKIIFYTILALFCCGILYLTTVMFLSPRQDAEKRGFITCTEKLVIDLQNCTGGNIGCPFHYMVQDMQCNIKVVASGVSMWLQGKQSTPWENYLFEPKPYVDRKQAESVPSVAEAQKEMSDLAQKSRFIELKHQELEEAKQRQLQINQGVLLHNPENPHSTDIAMPDFTDSEDVPQGDISAEADINIAPSAQDSDVEIIAPATENILQKLQKQTQEKLQKGNLKDEK